MWRWRCADAQRRQPQVHHKHYTDFQIDSRGEVFYTYEETDYVRMRERADKNRMFIYWKLTDIALLLTFKKGFRFENLKVSPVAARCVCDPLTHRRPPAARVAFKGVSHLRVVVGRPYRCIEGDCVCSCALRL